MLVGGSSTLPLSYGQDIVQGGVPEVYRTWHAGGVGEPLRAPSVPYAATVGGSGLACSLSWRLAFSALLRRRRLFAVNRNSLAGRTNLVPPWCWNSRPPTLCPRARKN